MEELEKYLETEEVLSLMQSICDKNGKMKVLNEEEHKKFRQFVETMKKYREMSKKGEQ